MRAKQVVKKIAALTAGLSMVGATIFGASAASLADYPSPLFIEDGRFNAFIVVGAAAASSDVVGAIEMATALQAASVKKTTSTVEDSQNFEVSDGVRVQRSGDPLLFGRLVSAVQDTNLDDTDMPIMLRRGTYDDDEGNNDNTADYEQEIEPGQSTGQVVFEQDDTDAPFGAPYLFFDQTSTAFTYILSFNDDVNLDNSSSGGNVDDDIVDTELEILGQTYTIISAGVDGNGELDDITFLAGETVIWLAKDEPITRVVAGAEHEIVLAGVNSGETKCSISVDGIRQIVDVGQTRTINGVEVGVSDSIHSDTGLDNCKVNIGATKIRIQDNDEIQLNDEDLDDTTGNIMMNGEGIWAGFNITVEAPDDTYIPAGESWVDPAFGAFKFTFGGLDSQEVETVTMSTSGDDGKFTFPNLDGKEIELEYTLDSANTVIMGDSADIDDRIYLEGEECDFTTSITECEGARFLVIASGGEAHLMEIQRFDTSDNKVDIKDLTYGTDNEEETFDEADISGEQTINLGSGAGAIGLTVTNQTGGTGGSAGILNFSSIDSNSAGAKTDGQAFLNFAVPHSTANSGFAVTLLEDNEDGAGGATWNLNFTYDSSDDELNIATPSLSTGAFHASNKDFSEDNDDDVWFVTNWSTTVLFDTEDKHNLVMSYPKGYREGLVYLSEVGSLVSEGVSVAVAELQPIQVGSAKLDSEVGDVTANNLIVVGGPCANTVAAELMGNPENCAEGFTEGEAMIKLFEHSNGKVALLVAGFSALDTRRATRVLASHAEYSAELVGEEVVVKGTTLNDVRVETATTA